MTSIPFVKMEGAGNDYVYFDVTDESERGASALRTRDELDFGALAKRLSDRHYGIGADGLILLWPSQRADVRMRMYNADGSEGSTCGNGLRCVAKLCLERGLGEDGALSIETSAGVVRARAVAEGEDAPSGTRPSTAQIEVTMGVPQVQEALVLDLGDCLLECTPVDLGNPHAVVFVESVERYDVAGIGARIQAQAHFPDSVNVEFVELLGPELLFQRTFERGSGETLACGSGAVAAAAVTMVRDGRFGVREVQLLGGRLSVHWSGEANVATASGPAREVFRGTVEV